MAPEPARQGSRRALRYPGPCSAGCLKTAIILRLLQPLSRWLGWSRVVLVVQRHDDVLVSTLPRDVPVAVRLNSNTDETVSVTIRHGDDGDALLADLQSLMS